MRKDTMVYAFLFVIVFCFTACETWYHDAVDENCNGIIEESHESFTNSLGMTFNLIPAGTFMMGSPEDELGRAYHEAQHEVTLTQDYYMQTTEVTQGQWEEVMGSNPSTFSECGRDCPVENVSWKEVQIFIKALNAKGKGTYTYRLPTEAQWEYAARAGSVTAFANGDVTATRCEFDENLDAMGWYCGNSDNNSPYEVAQKQPNTWGLYDMHGNVWEWSQDYWSQDDTSGPVTDPTGPDTGDARVTRGSSFYNLAVQCRSAQRGKHGTFYRNDGLGFRLASLPGQQSNK